MAVYGAYKLSKYVNSKNYAYHYEKGKAAYDDVMRRTELKRKTLNATYVDVANKNKKFEWANGYVKVKMQDAADAAGKAADRYSYKVSNAANRVLERELDRADTDSVADKVRNTYKYVKKKRR